MHSNDEGNEDCISECWFMAIDEEREEDFKRAFKELYVETIHMAKKNKELRKQFEAIT